MAFGVDRRLLARPRALDRSAIGHLELPPHAAHGLGRRTDGGGDRAKRRLRPAGQLLRDAGPQLGGIDRPDATVSTDAAPADQLRCTAGQVVPQPGNGLRGDAAERRDAPVRSLGMRAQDAAGRRPALLEPERQSMPDVAAHELDEGILGGSVEPGDLEGRQPQPTGCRARGAARRRPIGPHDAPRSAARSRRARRGFRRAGGRAPPPAVTAPPRAHRAEAQRRLRAPVDRASSQESSPSGSPPRIARIQTAGRC